MSFKSLTIERIKISYTEDIIKNIFWKYFLGKVYRVDFEPIETDSEYQTATIYRDEKYEWSVEIIKSINETDNFILYHTNFDGSNDCWTMKKCANPIPMATTTRNIHQLDHENSVLNDENCSLKARIAELEKKLNV
jgi:hypothetical protein